jgi:hypothetical protein
MAERQKQMIVDTVDLEALGDKIRAKTGLTDKMTVKEMNAALDNVGGGLKVIEVQELPTSNIDENAIYKIPRNFINCIVSTSGEGISLLEENMGLTIFGCNSLDDKPTDNIVESNLFSLQIYLYYIKNDNDIFVYGNLGYGSSWYTVGECFAIFGLTGYSFISEFEYGDLIQDSTGYYAYFDKEKYYKYTNDKFVEFSNTNNILGISLSNNTVFPQNRKLEYINYEEGKITHSFEFSKFKHIKITNLLKYRNSDFSFDGNLFYESEVETLHLIHLDKSVALGGYGLFNNAKKLTKLVIEFGEFAALNGDPFVDTPILNGTGYIYIPDDKVEEVKLLDGWSAVASQILPLSEYVEE